ncbi:MAG TPA: STAS domain-containing protein [Baekduia sp.]|nr:STAS domain-containing protein [Baekduia sp.]
MPVDFSVSPLSLDEKFIVEVCGEVDLFTAPDLKEAISGGIDAGADTIIVDLTQATFLDSTALGVLIGAVKRLRATDGGLSIVNVNSNIAKTFEITGLDQIFKIYESREQALASG